MTSPISTAPYGHDLPGFTPGRIGAWWKHARTFVADLAERVARTFIQGFAGTVAVSLVTATDVNAVRAAAIGGIAAGISAVMGLLSGLVRDPNSAGLVAP